MGHSSGIESTCFQLRNDAFRVFLVGLDAGLQLTRQCVVFVLFAFEHSGNQFVDAVGGQVPLAFDQRDLCRLLVLDDHVRLVPLHL